MQLRVNSVHAFFLISLCLLATVIAAGFRPNYVGSDTPIYLIYYNGILRNASNSFLYEYLFEFYNRVCAFFYVPDVLFLTGLACINTVNCIFIAQVICRYLAEYINFYRIFFLVISCLFISPFFFSMQLNVLRQGVASFLIFIYFLLLLRTVNVSNPIPTAQAAARQHFRMKCKPLNGFSFFYLVLVAFLALSFHQTTIFYILFSPLVYFKYSSVVRIALVLSGTYTLGLSSSLMRIFAEPLYNKIINYGISAGYKTGIRYDFVIFSLLCGGLFHQLSKYFVPREMKFQFMQFLKIYWILLLPFFLLGFGAFSDRYLLPAWGYLSILIAVFLALCLRKHRLSIYWYYVTFLLSSCYFILKAQGVY